MNNTSFLDIYNEWKSLQLPDIINFDAYNEILFTYHTTSIEGSSLTLEETTLLITDRLTAKAKDLFDHLMVRDHHQALAFVRERAQRGVAASSEFIQQINAMVMKSTGGAINAPSGAFDSSQGDFRKLMVSAGDKLFMDHKKVPAAVESLCQEIQTRSAREAGVAPVYNLAFDAHFKLALIHPFADGNGRTARLLMNFILIRHGLPPAIVYSEDKPDYIYALRKSDQTDDLNFFRAFMFQQQEKHLSYQIDKFTKQLK